MAHPSSAQQAQDPFDDWEQAYNTASHTRPTPSTNAQLWEAPSYMPMTASSSTSQTYSSVQLPPQPQMTILKRPSSSSSQQSQSASSSTNAPAKSLAQREQEYKDARARIFGAETDSPLQSSQADRKDGASSRKSPAPSNAVKPMRVPQGPTDEGTGFAARRKPKAPTP